MFHALEDARREDDPLENLALIDQVCQAARVRLLLELRAGAIALLGEDLVDAPAHFSQQLPAHQAGHYEIAAVIELPLVGISEHAPSPDRAAFVS